MCCGNGRDDGKEMISMKVLVYIILYIYMYIYMYTFTNGFYP